MLHITGDTHGEQARFLYSKEEKTWGPNDYIIICGDFGYLFRNNDSENRFLDDLEQRPYTICFVDGNHENFDALNQYPVEEWCGGKVHRIRKNLVHLMRGQVFQIDGKKIFTMGGAYSIDRPMRQRNVSYWEEELPDKHDYEEALASLALHNYCVDYIVTHTAPREMILRMGHVPDPHDMELTGFLEYLMYKVRHTHWFCGHWHQDRNLSDRFTVLWLDVRTIL